ncbi:MAG: hypothetical protein FJ301_05590 [Planctomycetes bacterium]|nr:hypothetical protein [Planctomycetota bacterium]
MPTTPAASTSHRWSFYRAGGVDQVRFRTGADVLNLDQLDQQLWIALSCPVKGLEIDDKTLAMLDSDNDSHVRPPEILAAVRWLRTALTSGDCLLAGVDGVALADLRADTDEGKALRASAEYILASLRKPLDAITIADAAKVAEVFASARRNGDGVVPPETLADAASKQVADELIDCVGGALDRSGKPGFEQTRLDAFFAACAEFDAWHKAGEAGRKDVFAFGDATGDAWTALAAVRGKVDDYFGRCRLAAFDPRALAAVNREEDAYMAAAAKDLTITAAEVAHFPLAIVAPDKPLPLGIGVNPAWSEAIGALRAACCPGKNALTEAEWVELCGKLAPYAAWLQKKAGVTIEKLGIARVRAILAGPAKARLQQAITDDLAEAPKVDAMARVEKLCRLHRDFITLLNNYVAFTDFYAGQGAIFQAGRLLLDGRSLGLCFHVNDAAKHSAMAAMAQTFLAYVECTRLGSPKMQVACAFTAGDSDNLFVGRNGIFYDRKGNDWDATIVKIVDNPISVRQAFWSPYKKFVRWIEEQVQKRAAEADTATTGKLQDAASKAGTAAATGSPGATAAPKKLDIGVVAALSVAISGITAIVGSMLEAFFGLGYLMPLGLIGVLLLISGPSMSIAYMKLRQRNLGPILDANGWAVNTLTRVNIPLGSSLTSLPKVPAGAERSLVDPFAEEKSAWPRVLLALLLAAGVAWVLYRANVLHRWFPDVEVLRHHAEFSLQIDKQKATAGDRLVLTVRSADDELEIYDAAEGGALVAKLKVEAGKATWTIPADRKAGALFVRDSASMTDVVVEVEAKK